jgi:hypothetical protein
MFQPQLGKSTKTQVLDNFGPFFFHEGRAVSGYAYVGHLNFQKLENEMQGLLNGILLLLLLYSRHML